MTIEWYAESLRLTFFALPDLVQRPLFVELTGVPPAEQVARPLLKFQQENGNAFGAYVNIIQQPGRVDIVFSDAPDMSASRLFGSEIKAFFWLGKLDASIAIFESIVSKAIAAIDSAFRVAYAVTALKQVESMTATLNILRECLPRLEFDPETDADLIFQITRPQKARDGRKIIELVRWQSLQATVQFHSNVASVALPHTRSAFAAHVYADVSSDAENKTAITGHVLRDLIDDLRAVAVQVVERGEQ